MLKTYLLSAYLLGCMACAGTLRADDPGARMSNQIAEIMVQNRVYETATPLLRQGIAADPNNARLHRLFATVLRDRGVYEQALVEYRLARKWAPWDPDVAAGLGVLYDLRGQDAAAEMWHREALRCDADRADLYNNLGFSMQLHGDFYSAATAYFESLRRNPNQPRVYNNLGFTYARLGNMTSALSSFQQGGSRAQAQANMGLAFELSGDLVQARERYEAALKIDRTLEAARHNLRNLTEMEREGENSTKLAVPPSSLN